MGGEFGRGIGVWGRGEKGRDVEVVNVNVGERFWIPTLSTNHGLTVVCGRADEVEREVVSQDEAREVEELVEVALCRERDHHDHHLGGWKEHAIVVHFFAACVVGSHARTFKARRSHSRGGKVGNKQNLCSMLLSN